MPTYDSDMGDLMLLVRHRNVEEPEPTEARRIRAEGIEAEWQARRDAAQARIEAKWPCHPQRDAGWREGYCRECGGAMDDGSNQEIAQEAGEMRKQWKGVYIPR